MSSEITPENVHLYASPCMCGVVNTETGEFKEGVMAKDGQLTYCNPLPWWKRLFGRKAKVELWGEPQYVTTVHGTRKLVNYAIWRGADVQTVSTTAAIYRETHRYTGARRYWVKDSWGSHYIDTVAYERDGSVVEA